MIIPTSSESYCHLCNCTMMFFFPYCAAPLTSQMMASLSGLTCPRSNNICLALQRHVVTMSSL